MVLCVTNLYEVFAAITHTASTHDQQTSKFHNVLKHSPHQSLLTPKSLSLKCLLRVIRPALLCRRYGGNMDVPNMSMLGLMCKVTKLHGIRNLRITEINFKKSPGKEMRCKSLLEKLTLRSRNDPSSSLLNFSARPGSSYLMQVKTSNICHVLGIIIHPCIQSHALRIQIVVECICNYVISHKTAQV